MVFKQKSLRHRALDESRFNIGRVKQFISQISASELYWCNVTFRPIEIIPTQTIMVEKTEIPEENHRHTPS